MIQKLPEGGDRFLWTEIPVQPIARAFVDILKFEESQHPRNPSGTREGGRFTRSPHEQKRRDFFALIKRQEREETNMNRMRKALVEQWQVWSEDTKKGRKKPLNPDGAAAKKLDSYKKAKEMEAVFHARFEAVMVKTRAWDKKAEELLKVPVEQRSTVKFKKDATAHLLSPYVLGTAGTALAKFREFDGSGAFKSTKFTAEMIENIKKLGQGGSAEFLAALQENPDGTFELPSRLQIGKSDIKRANATALGVKVSGGSDVDRQVFHEVAHHIEMNRSEVKKAAIAWRESKANQPREIYKLKDIKPGMEDDEIALRGKFQDEYQGKLYPDDIATEVVSTGVEQYMMDPVAFAQRDPDHFNFIFDVMHGKYRSPQ